MVHSFGSYRSCTFGISVLPILIATANLRCIAQDSIPEARMSLRAFFESHLVNDSNRDGIISDDQDGRCEEAREEAKERLVPLRRGIEETKARKPSDPPSWFFQAAAHGVTDEMVIEASERDVNLRSVNCATFWNQCPHGGQPTADFLAWHRAPLLL